MVGRPANASPDIFFPYTPRLRGPAKGTIKHGKPAAWVRFTPELFETIRSEAELRGWSFTRMVNHLCEASIEGIE